jgi:pyruvyltransferase
MKTFFLDDMNFNAGDMISKPVLEALGMTVELVNRKTRGKLLAIGSIMSALRAGDTVWGSGCIRDKIIQAPPGAQFLAVRGPKTRNRMKGAAIPEIFGDPGLLLPLIYRPNDTKRYKLGVLPHYIDKGAIGATEGHLIDIQAPWQTVINEIVSCDRVVSSTLHGIVFCEAYGVPVTWSKYSDNIIGGAFKFQDYFMGTGRKPQRYWEPIDPLEGLAEIQQGLMKALAGKYGTKIL